MPFFYCGTKSTPTLISGAPIESFHQYECLACPLNGEESRLQHPKMPAHGADHPAVYMLGEAPGQHEDEEGIPFVGSSGEFLRGHVPEHWTDECMRWSNVIRCHPENNRDPHPAEIESCRPYSIRDIEAAQPEAIFGFGGVPLKWLLKRGGITKWNGRRIPIKVGSHTCWYFPLLHPAYVQRLEHASASDSYNTMYENAKFVFAFDLNRAFQAVEAGLPVPVVHDRAFAEADTDLLTNCDQIIAALAEMARDKIVGLDLETKNIRPYLTNSRILTVALSSNRRTLAFPLYHDGAGWSDDERTRIEDAFVQFLLDPYPRKISFQLSFELEWLAYFYGDAVVHTQWGDAQAQAYLLEPHSPPTQAERMDTLSLDFTCLNYFGIDVKAITNTDRNNLDKTPVGTVLRYNAIDAKYHRLAYLHQLPMLTAEQGLLTVYQHHVRRAKAAVLCQLQGVPVNQATAHKLADKYLTEIKAIEDEIAAVPVVKKFKTEKGYDFRPSASTDLRYIIYEMLQIEQRGNTTNEVLLHLEGSSTKESVLEIIDHPIAKLILEYRGAAKSFSTYVKPLLLESDESAVFPDQMLHPQLSLTKVRTWRSSCEHPNIQNFPKYGDAKIIRSQIEAPNNHKIVAFDFGQIQARNVAMESRDQILVQSFWDRHDIHSDWAKRIMDLHPAWVTEGVAVAARDKKVFKKYRQRAKNEFVFASFFGAGGRKVAATLGIPEEIGLPTGAGVRRRFPTRFSTGSRNCTRSTTPMAM